MLQGTFECTKARELSGTLIAVAIGAALSVSQTQTDAAELLPAPFELIWISPVHAGHNLVPRKHHSHIAFEIHLQLSIL
jgi:predicted alpha/beta-hydrolase family hydrolase